MFSPSTTGTLWRSNSGSLGLADPLPVNPSPQPVVDTCEANLGKSLKGQAAVPFRKWVHTGEGGIPRTVLVMCQCLWMGPCLSVLCAIIFVFASRECSPPQVRSCSTASRTLLLGWSWRLVYQVCSLWNFCFPHTCRSRRRCSSTEPPLSGEWWPFSSWS